jgi:hypothetical protein
MAEVPRLLSAAMSLRAASPTGWGEFIEALGERGADLSRQLVKAPPPMMQVAQGRAQEAVAFHELMRDVTTRVDAITSRSKPQHVRQQPTAPVDPYAF